MSHRFEPRRLSVAVLAGGTSAEREISLASGRNVTRALLDAGHDARMHDPKDVSLSSESLGWADICFIALHGGEGEDGRVQAKLESLDITYTGSRPTSCRLAMDKVDAKGAFQAAGLPTPEFFVHYGDDGFGLFQKKITEFGFPAVIKPISQGSSLGVGMADNSQLVAACYSSASQFDKTILVERRIFGREITVSVLNGRPLDPLEIISSAGTYDYAAKYDRADTRYSFELGLDRTATLSIQDLAVEATRSLAAQGLIRVDMILDETCDPWLLELNTIPGMTDRSLSPMAAAYAGIDMPQLCDRMIQNCHLAEPESNECQAS